MSKKDEILEKIKTPFLNFTREKADPVGFIRDESDDLCVEYIARARENKSVVIECEKSEITAKINEILAEQNAQNLIYPSGLGINLDEISVRKFEFNRPIEEFKERLFEFDVSIIRARKAVSSHGVICVASSQTQPRLLSLTPRVCIVLLRRKDVVKSLNEAIKQIKNEDGRLPTNVLFISGPSRTSDIELVTVLGVHGSQNLYVLIY